MIFGADQGNLKKILSFIEIMGMTFGTVSKNGLKIADLHH